MSFSRQILEQVRQQSVEQIIEANARIADIDQTLAILDGATAAPAEGKAFNHTHWGMTEANVAVPPFDNGGDVHMHVHGAATVTNETGAPEHVLTPEQFEAASARAQAYLDTLAEEPFEPVPPADELTFTAPPAPEPKSGGRRTNEEIAAEIGVNLEDVKEWKGGGRISRADMEEFKKLHAGAAIPGQQTIDDVGAPEPDVEAAPGMWTESDTSGGEADTANEWADLPVEDVKATAEAIKAQNQADYEADLQRRAQAEGPSNAEQAEPPSYGTADEAVVADDAETFEPPF